MAVSKSLFLHDYASFYLLFRLRWVVSPPFYLGFLSLYLSSLVCGVALGYIVFENTRMGSFCVEGKNPKYNIQMYPSFSSGRYTPTLLCIILPSPKTDISRAWLHLARTWEPWYLHSMMIQRNPPDSSAVLWTHNTCSLLSLAQSCGSNILLSLCPANGPKFHQVKTDSSSQIVLYCMENQLK